MSNPNHTRPEAIYIVEYAGIPIGIDVLDRMVKRASADILYARPVCIGKFLIVMGGGVDDVREARQAAADTGAKALQERLLTGAHSEILTYFHRVRDNRKKSITDKTAVGILETRHAASGFYSLDAALKRGRVRLEQLWLGHCIGGKFCYILSGCVEDIHSALTAARESLDPAEIVSDRIIPALNEKAAAFLFRAYG